MNLRHLSRCALGLVIGLSTESAGSAPCFLSPKSNSPVGATTTVQDGSAQIVLSGPRAFDNCERVTVAKGVAVAQYLDKQGKPASEELGEGKGVAAQNLDANVAPVRGVARGLLAVLTNPKERGAAGQKFFDKPAQVGAPFGDVYIPPNGLTLQFVNLEAEARVQITDAASKATVIEGTAAQGLTLDRARIRPGGTYGVRVLSSRGKAPPGAFEVVTKELATELDQALAAIDADPVLDPATRAIGRALIFEREGLSFNREMALREVKS